jgi:hypothetical protein
MRKLILLIACILFGAVTARGALADEAVIGVNLVNAPYDLAVPEQQTILDALQAAGVHVIRAAIPANGWNGCVTRTNCSDGLEESAFSVEIQATGTGPVFVAVVGRRLGLDLDGATLLSAVRHRLANAAGKLASDSGWMR